MAVKSSGSLTLLISLGLILSNFAFFYFFSVSLKGVIFALFYFMGAVLLPGYVIGLIFLHIFHYDSDGQPSWHLLLPLSTVFGVGNILLSYIVGQMLNIHAAYYLFAWTYFMLAVKPIRILLRSSLDNHLKSSSTVSDWNLCIVLLFILGVNILLFLTRPTPGILPLDIFHDHIWNAGNTVSLVSNFPLQSMNIETKPYIGYHILIHILGAHISLITGLTPHLVGLQFIFVPLVPLLIFNMVSLLNQFLKHEGIYLFYALAVLLFGGGFSIVHEVKVNSYLTSSTNFLGVILLFSVMTLMMHSHRVKSAGRLVLVFLGLFLSTAAKGSIGTALLMATILWIFFRIWKKTITLGDYVDCTGAILGFALSYFVFFGLPSSAQPIATDFIKKSSFLLVPLSYVTENYLTRPFIDVIYKYSPGQLQLLFHVILTIFVLPVYILLFFSYRLIAIYNLKTHGINKKNQRIIFVAIGSLLVAYMVNMGPQSNAYFVNSALYILDVLFVVYLQKENVFSLLQKFWQKKHIYAAIGLIFIMILPFLSMGGWNRREYAYNFFMYGKIGQSMDAKFAKTEYRQTRQSITPEIYDALKYIRQNTPNEVVVVTPFIDLKSGKPLAFYTSAFAERTVFFEGYGFGGIQKYIGHSQINKRIETTKKIYHKYDIPEEMKNNRYVFLVNTETKNELEKKYDSNILYENHKWCVLQIRMNNS